MVLLANVVELILSCSRITLNYTDLNLTSLLLSDKDGDTDEQSRCFPSPCESTLTGAARAAVSLVCRARER